MPLRANVNAFAFQISCNSKERLESLLSSSTEGDKVERESLTPSDDVVKFVAVWALEISDADEFV